MIELSNLVEKWDFKRESNKELKLSDINFYKNIYDNILSLAKFKFEQYQPLPHPDEKDFLSRLLEWLEQFKEDKQKFLFFLASKIIFFTRDQIDYLMKNVFERRIKREILKEIINDNSRGINNYDFKKAIGYFQVELDKTLFCGLSDSARINDFVHINREINRRKSTGFDLPTLLYPSKIKDKLSGTSLKDLCKKFEAIILEKDDVIADKSRLVVLEDTCCSGSDFINFLNNIRDIDLPFKSIYLAPYIISYMGKKNIENWINKNKRLNYNVTLVYGSYITKELKCFDEDQSYLKIDWKDNKDICEEIKKISTEIYNQNFSENLKKEDRFGVNGLKNVFVTYYNCPDTSLPIIWFPNEGNWKPIFLRSSRII